MGWRSWLGRITHDWRRHRRLYRNHIGFSAQETKNNRIQRKPKSKLTENGDQMSARQAFFNQAAQNWDKEFDNPQLHAFLEQFVPSFGLSAGQHVLDVGTGTGILIPFLHKALGSKGHITAIDYAQNMVDICKTKYAHLPNVSIMVADAEKLQFPDESFDAVTCFGLVSTFG